MTPPATSDEPDVRAHPAPRSPPGAAARGVPRGAWLGAWRAQRVPAGVRRTAAGQVVGLGVARSGVPPARGGAVACPSLWPRRCRRRGPSAVGRPAALSGCRPCRLRRRRLVRPAGADRAPGGLGGLLLGFLLAAAGAGAVRDTTDAGGSSEGLLVVGAGLGDQVLRNAEPLGRGELLEAGLPVQAGAEVRGLLDQRVEEPVHQLGRPRRGPGRDRPRRSPLPGCRRGWRPCPGRPCPLRPGRAG